MPKKNKADVTRFFHAEISCGSMPMSDSRPKVIATPIRLVAVQIEAGVLGAKVFDSRRDPKHCEDEDGEVINPHYPHHSP
jgi:hypothetical protein